MKLCPARSFVPWKLKNPNSVFLMIGPPKVPPYWFRRNVGLSAPTRLAKKFVPSNLSLRMNSYSEPWYWLVPDFVLTSTFAPMR